MLRHQNASKCSTNVRLAQWIANLALPSITRQQGPRVKTCLRPTPSSDPLLPLQL
jgi:hypothetical protein